MNYYYLLEFIIYVLLTLCLTYQVMKKSFFSDKKMSIVVSILFSFFLMLLFPLDFFNASISLGVFLILWIFFDLLLKKKIDSRLILGISSIICFTFLGYAYYCKNHVIETHYRIKTDKEIGESSFRIAQISDSHIGFSMSSTCFLKYINKINQAHPDVVVITGDFVDDDTSKKEMEKASYALSKLKTKYGVYYVYGNHDRGYHQYRDFNEEELRKELGKNGVIVLQDEVIQLTDYITLIGREDQRYPRKEIEELVKEVDPDSFQIVLNHQPTDYENESKSNVDLVLSGHTHGGQFFPIGQVSVLLGINDSYKGIKTIQNTTFIVNTGLSDWGFQFKTGTFSEYGIIDITN